MAITLLTPQEAYEKHLNTIPDYVYQAFNQLLIENIKSPTEPIAILTSDVVERITQLCTEETPITTNEMCDRRYLSVAKTYEFAGWIVEYKTILTGTEAEVLLYIFTPTSSKPKEVLDTACWRKLYENLYAERIRRKQNKYKRNE